MMLGLNVRPFQSTPALLAALNRMGAAWALVDSDPLQARLLTEAGYRVIYRAVWPGSDDDLHKRVSPAQWAAHMQLLDVPLGALLYAGNEPTTDLPGLVAWTLAALDIADTLGRRLVVGNFSSGTPEPEDWRGVLAPLLRRLSGTPHMLGLHEYLVGTLSESVPWHVGRFRFMLDACRELGITPPRWCVTEFAHDVTGSWQSAGYPPDMAAAAWQRAVDEVYADSGCEFMPLLFSYGEWENGQGWAFDVRQAIPYLRPANGRSGGDYGDPGGQSMEMKLASVTVTAKSLTRRKAPGTESDTISGKFAEGKYELHVSEPQVLNGYVWRKFVSADLDWWSATGPVAEPAKWVAVEYLPQAPDELAVLRAQVAALTEERDVLRLRVADLERELADRGDVFMRDRMLVAYAALAEGLGYEKPA